MKNLLIVTASALITFGILNQDLFEPGHAHIEEAVSEKLRDPDSAQFRSIRVGDGAACGEVNGKNGFGAYSGYRKFVYIDGTVMFEPIETARSNNEYQAGTGLSAAAFKRLQYGCEG